ncbi:MAG: hypothetical protein ABI488_11085 [Polyangiaceae bacterium]
MTRGTTGYLLFGACVASFLGCGGRTEELFDEAGTGGFISAGGDGVGGSSVGGSGPITFAGGASVAGGPFATAGAPNTGHSPGIAGAPGFAGFPSVGGSSGFAGMPNFGGMSGIAGFPGDAGAGGVIVDACVSVAPTACERCQCQACAAEVVGCFADRGCAAIFSCIATSGCQGFNCYTDATCRKVINAFGGLTGSAVSEVFALGSCALSSQNVCACN